MLEKNKPEKARQILKRIRGVFDKEIEAEFKDRVTASEASKAVKNPWRNIRNRQFTTIYRHQCYHVLCTSAFQNNWVW